MHVSTGWLATLSCVLEDIVYPVDRIVCGGALDVALGGRLEDYFLLFLVGVDCFLARHAGVAQFWQSHVLFLVSEVRHSPLFSLFVPL